MKFFKPKKNLNHNICKKSGRSPSKRLSYMLNRDAFCTLYFQFTQFSQYFHFGKQCALHLDRKISWCIHPSMHDKSCGCAVVFLHLKSATYLRVNTVFACGSFKPSKATGMSTSCNILWISKGKNIFITLLLKYL